MPEKTLFSVVENYMLVFFNNKKLHHFLSFIPFHSKGEMSFYASRTISCRKGSAFFLPDLLQTNERPFIFIF